METTVNLDRLFYPKNIAVIGASPKKNGAGQAAIRGSPGPLSSVSRAQSIPSIQKQRQF
ncbi:MAG: hypothetical protein JRG81_10520 [Deltaproteobacteria bacterium]|nr:hypothetical protein [Deltaproteobacteria bacterium]